MSIGNLPESLSQAILVGIILVGRLGVRGNFIPQKTRVGLDRNPLISRFEATVSKSTVSKSTVSSPLLNKSVK